MRFFPGAVLIIEEFENFMSSASTMPTIEEFNQVCEWIYFFF